MEFASLCGLLLFMLLVCSKACGWSHLFVWGSFQSFLHFFFLFLLFYHFMLLSGAICGSLEFCLRIVCVCSLLLLMFSEKSVFVNLVYNEAKSAFRLQA